MMLSVRGVSIVLLIIWGIVYKIIHKRIGTSKIYFILLALMAIPGLFLENLPLMGLAPRSFYLDYIVLFSFLMLVNIKPWISFDKFYKKVPVFKVKNKYIGLIKVVFIITIILSSYSMIYVFPYAKHSMLVGALEIRHSLVDDSILPKNIFTTLAVGFASFSPFAALLFFVSLLDNRLRKYSILLMFSSLSYIVVTLSIGARDGYIFTFLTYVVLYILFRKSYSSDIIQKNKRNFVLILSVLVVFFLVITLSRFWGDENNASYEELLYGTWGYLYQQPYVFNHVLDQFTDFYGFNRRLMFMENLIYLPGKEYSANLLIEYMFGTHFAEFYEISGYSSLIVITFLYVVIFNSLIKYFYRKKKVFSLILSFLIYYYFTISGIFYFRFGGNDSEFLFFISILFSSFFIPNILSVKKQNE